MAPDEVQFCSSCGAPHAPDARFCSRCGAKLAGAVPEPVTVPPPVPTEGVAGAGAPIEPPPTAPPVAAAAEPPSPRRPAADRRTPLQWLALLFAGGILILLLVIGWLIIRDAGEARRPGSTPLAVESEREPLAPAEADTATAPPAAVSADPPVIREIDPRAAAGGEVAEPSPGPELGEAESLERLRSWIAQSDFYGRDTDCLTLRSRGYSNRGYNIDALASGCRDRRDGVVDRWRVDTATGSVYRQQEDGRYLSP
jgi:hypothetical protein